MIFGRDDDEDDFAPIVHVEKKQRNEVKETEKPLKKRNNSNKSMEAKVDNGNIAAKVIIIIIY